MVTKARGETCFKNRPKALIMRIDCVDVFELVNKWCIMQLKYLIIKLSVTIWICTQLHVVFKMHAWLIINYDHGIGVTFTAACDWYDRLLNAADVILAWGKTCTTYHCL